MVSFKTISYGAINADEWEALAESLIEVSGKEGWVIEIGTLSGRTTKAITVVLRGLGYSTPVITVDKDSYSARSWKRFDPKVHFHYGTSSSVFKVFPDIKISWAFIDGCHCSECVGIDIRNIAPRIIPEGFICLHDADPRNREFGMKVHGRYHGDGKVRLYGVNHAIDNSVEMKDFRLVKSLEARDRPNGPTPIFGGLQIWQKSYVLT